MARPKKAAQDKTQMVAVYIFPEQREQLKELTARTRVPMAAYWREALDDLLEKYGDVLKSETKKRSKQR
jgi:predicted DNA-binding protein